MLVQGRATHSFHRRLWITSAPFGGDTFGRSEEQDHVAETSRARVAVADPVPVGLAGAVLDVDDAASHPTLAGVGV